MHTVCISIHLGRCVIVLEAVDIQVICKHCYRNESGSGWASYLHSLHVWRHNVALRDFRLFVVSTGMSHRDQICFTDLLFSRHDIWRFTQTSRCLHPSLRVHSCLCVCQNMTTRCSQHSVCSAHVIVWVKRIFAQVQHVPCVPGGFSFSSLIYKHNLFLPPTLRGRELISLVCMLSCSTAFIASPLRLTCPSCSTSV